MSTAVCTPITKRKSINLIRSRLLYHRTQLFCGLELSELHSQLLVLDAARNFNPCSTSRQRCSLSLQTEPLPSHLTTSKATNIPVQFAGFLLTLHSVSWESSFHVTTYLTLSLGKDTTKHEVERYWSCMSSWIHVWALVLKAAVKDHINYDIIN